MKRFFRVSIDPRILAELKPQRGLVVLGLSCSGVAAGLFSLVAWFVKFTLDAVQKGQPERLMQLSLAVILLFLVKYWFTRGQTYYLSMAALRLTTELRVKLFAKLQRLPLSYFGEKRAGAIQSVLTNDVNVYQGAIAAIRDAVDGPIKIVVGMITIFVLQWKLALAACLVIPLMIIVIERNARKMQTAQTEVQNDLAGLTAMMGESIQGSRLIKIFGAEQVSIQKFRELAQRSLRSQINAVRRVAGLRPLVELMGAVALALVVLLCGQLISRGELTVDTLGAFIMALDVINQGAKNLGSLKQTLAQVQAATDRIHQQVLDVPEPMEDRPGAGQLDRVSGKIEFREVSFAYPDGTQALKSVSFTIEPGTSLALVGPSGAGKSTLADLILRFYEPSSGKILLDGVDIRELKTSWLRAQLGVVPQQTFLFAGSILENIRLGDPDASEQEALEAARTAHAEGFIASLPNTLATEVGERGVRLSGGEAQRIAIARALVRKPTLLLLDEATSNLDAVSEQAVQEALEEIMPGRTTLLIAHRLTTAARADKILVLRQGEVMETGSHAELMEQNGVYAGMYRAFAGGLLDASTL